MARKKNEIPSTQPISLRVTTENKMWLDFNATNKSNMINLGIQLIRLLCEREPLILRYIDMKKNLPPMAMRTEKETKTLAEVVENTHEGNATFITAIIDMIV